MKIRYIFITVILIIGSLTISCSKKKLNKKLDGKWKMVDVTVPINDSISENDSTAQINQIYWTFMNNEIVITLDNGTKEDTVDIGSYILKIKLEVKEFSTKGFGSQAYGALTGEMEYRERFYNDKWKIDILKDDILAIYSDRENNMQYFEFIKAE